jgi:pyruvate ferredoxin oxidoreductase alpha subunit
MMGSFATKAKQAVISLRQSGIKIGLVRPRLIRPFPDQAFIKALTGKKAVAVIDQNLSMGKGGVLHSEITSVLYGLPDMPPIVASFIGGLGGRDITQEEFYRIADTLAEAVKLGRTPKPRLLYTKTELTEFKKLQAIAQVERYELKEQQK